MFLQEIAHFLVDIRLQGNELHQLLEGTRNGKSQKGATHVYPTVEGTHRHDMIQDSKLQLLLCCTVTVKKKERSMTI